MVSPGQGLLPGCRELGAVEDRGVLAQHRGPRMGRVRPPDATGGATLEVSDMLSLCEGSQETVSVHFLSCRHCHPPVLLQARSLSFPKSGLLTGLHPPPRWLGRGMCPDRAPGIRRKAGQELLLGTVTCVCVQRKAAIAAHCSSCVITARPEAPAQPVPPHSHTSQKSSVLWR